MSTTGRPKLSVCVMTYNQERYIRDCLQSIVDQKTDFPFQVIVADDCSKDGTRAIIHEFGERYPEVIKPVLRPINLGPTKNFMDLHNSVETDYVAHMDGDDLMLPGKLQKQVAFLDANPEFSVVWHRVNLFDDKGGFLPGENYDLSAYPKGVVTLEHSLRLGSVAAHSSIMYRRSARKTRQIDFEILDLFYTWEYLSAGKGKILEDVLGSYRVSSQGSMQGRSQGQNPMQSEGMIRVLKIVAHHARYYLHLMPEQRRNIFVFALIQFMVDVKYRRSSAWAFGKLALESVSIVPPSLILKSISEMQRVPPCSPLGEIPLARSRREKQQTS